MQERLLENAMRLHGNTVLRIAYSVLRNMHDAEDIFSDVFFALFKSQKRFENDNHLRAWLIRVAANKAINYKKSFFRSKKVPLHEGIEDKREERDLDVSLALAKLKPLDSAILYLHYFEGYNFAEIADTLKINRSSVRSRAMRAKEKLREIL